jgi:hypothetical protein
MKFLRRAHLYLGVFFAPLLLFFIATGWYQTLYTNRNKSLGEQQTWIDKLTSIHVDSIYPAESANTFSPTLFRVLVVAMAVALIVTVLIGVYLAFKTLRVKWPVWAALVLGVLVPVLCLWLGLGK